MLNLDITLKNQFNNKHLILWRAILVVLAVVVMMLIVLAVIVAVLVVRP